MCRGVLLAGVLLLLRLPVWAQGHGVAGPGKMLVIYADSVNKPVHIPARTPKLLSQARQQSATITVDYVGFSPEAKAAFQAAVDIWNSLITSPVPIKVHAEWSPLGSSILGQASYTSAYQNFYNAPRSNVYYPVPLAERLAGFQLNNPDDADISAQFSSQANWYYKTDGNPGANQYDLVSVVLHELCHGLGFSGSFGQDNSGSTGFYGLDSNGTPIIFDIALEDGSGKNLIQTYTNPSATLLTHLTNNDLYYNDDFITSEVGEPIKLFAPTAWQDGSSVSHLDESTYHGADALMTPSIAPMESIHDPGISLDILEDMGWWALHFDHAKLKDSETASGSYPVNVTITGDNWTNTQQVTLLYAFGNGTLHSVSMTSGGSGAYSASIPSSGQGTYHYAITTTDDLGRTFSLPGRAVVPKGSEQQVFYSFKVGPDTESPTISHVPPDYVLLSSPSITFSAYVTDNVGVGNVKLEYQVNNGPLIQKTMTAGTPDSLYTITESFGTSIALDDVIHYQIVATDNSSNSNVATSPIAGSYDIPVTDIVAAQNSYENNFNGGTKDFFGNGFSVTTSSGFDNEAIQSEHPYPEASSLGKTGVDLVYELRVPILIKSDASLMKFDEVVLVEPGETGAAFGSEAFYDYVVVEGSTDGGVTWTPVEDGYDSRDDSDWLARFQSQTSNDNSTAPGDSTLYKERVIDLKTKYNAGDEVLFRFRLHSDPFAYGWGWAIDNLRIQLDDQPPTIHTDFPDYVETGTPQITFNLKASDPSGLAKLKVALSANDAAADTIDLPVSPPNQLYTLNVDVSSLSAGDIIHYKIISVDSLGFTGPFPITRSIDIPVIKFGTAVTHYSNNFNTTTNDFAGGFFEIKDADGFNSAAIQSDHNYLVGFGLDGNTDYTYTLEKPIIIDASNPYIRYRDVALVEGHDSGNFGDASFKDYVVVEGSKDDGNTWTPFDDGYDASSNSNWLDAIATDTNGDSTMYQTHLVDMTTSGDFADGDQVLIRFRLHSDSTINDWGWAIDDLYIQDPVTAVESTLDSQVRIYPNPVTDQPLRVTSDAALARNTAFTLINLQGQTYYKAMRNAGQAADLSIDLNAMSPGMYVLIIDDGQQKVVKKVVKVR